VGRRLGDPGRIWRVRRPFRDVGRELQMNLKVEERL
jgi:hypothetical protein